MKKDFISIADYSPSDLQNMLDLAVELKNEWKAGGNKPILKNKVMSMIFQKPSLRTRVSFDMAMRHLGGDALYLSPAEIGLGKRESIADVARVLSGYVDIIMARVFDHEHILQLAKWAEVPVINGLSDYNHPCQGMADALTIYEEFGSLKGLNVTFIGDGNNVAVSLMNICSKLGANFIHSGPAGYLLSQDEIVIARNFANESGATINHIADPHEAVKGANVIYTDTWTSMGQEEETLKREAVFPPYQINKALINVADKNVIVMHCLPAHRGQEITDEIADGGHSRLFPQAHNRLHAQKAIIVKIIEKA
jgi:ornithine carbamoyltransferase